ncbi:MAG: beta-1,6-N-acetylglucosaminyltransferase [Hyphomicrobiaceae bacterium]
MRWTTREATDRYLFHYAPLKANPHTLDRAILKIPRLLIARTKNYRLETSFGVMLGRRPARTPFSQEFKLYGGSYWMIIRRTAVRAALELVDERPDIVNYFRHVISPEESFLQTVLANDKRLSLSRQELRLWDFENGRHGFARFFGVEDLEHLCASGRYIARKFDRARDSRILDELDRIVLDSAARRPKSLRLASG